jgi:hypothetical protein
MEQCALQAPSAVNARVLTVRVAALALREKRESAPAPRAKSHFACLVIENLMVVL